MKKKVVYIASRAHSGSTFLNLLLSAHPRLIGVGEVYSLFNFSAGHLNRRDKIQCSCGEAIGSCPFWRPTIDLLLQNQDMPPHQLYGIVLDAFREHFGNDQIMVDASKTLIGLDALRRNRQIDLKVIFLIRDVRAWLISMRNDRARRSDLHFSDLFRRYGVKSPLEYLFRTPIKYFWHWYLLNRKTQRYLSQEKISTFQVGYEEVSLYPEFSLKKIGQFLDVTFQESMVTLENSGSHIVLGNRMRNQAEKRARIYYDNRWFYKSDWLLASFLFPRIMNYNECQVYGNIKNRLWDL
jgi:hypothetical protein